MDITHLFKAGVMTVKLQRKSELPPQALDQKRILPKMSSGAAASHRDEFARQAKDVCNKITTLRNVLLENRAAYMRIGQHLKNAAHMTDEQRDLIDRESEKFVAYYTQHLAQLRADWKRAKRKKQQLQHIDAVLELLERYLRSVQQIYLEQKRYRVQHELESYRLLKLAADKKKIPVRPASEQSARKQQRCRQRQRRLSSTGTMSTDESSDNELAATQNNNKLDAELQGDWRDDDDDDDDDEYDNQMTRIDDNFNSSGDTTTANGPQIRHRHKHGQEVHDISGGSTGDVKSTQSSQKVALDEDIQKSQQLVEAEAEAGKLSPEDVQLYEQENVQLYHELQGLAEEVEQIEKNVVDIAQLQDIFTEKVSLQQHNIERIANAVVGATENVKDANEQIKQAIQRNAGLRVWSLFFLLVMSFALLFLDWYYD